MCVLRLLRRRLLRRWPDVVLAEYGSPSLRKGDTAIEAKLNKP